MRTASLRALRTFLRSFAATLMRSEGRDESAESFDFPSVTVLPPSLAVSFTAARQAGSHVSGTASPLRAKAARRGSLIEPNPTRRPGPPGCTIVEPVIVVVVVVVVPPVRLLCPAPVVNSHWI